MRLRKIIVFLLYCYLVIFPFGQLVRIPALENFPQVHFYLTDIVVGLLGMFGWLGVLGRLRKKKLSFPPLAKPIYLFAIFTFLSLAVNFSRLSEMEMVVAWLYWLRWVFYAGVYFIIYDLTQKSSTSWRFKTQKLLNYLILAGAVAAILGLLQYVFLPDTRFLEAYGWDPHYYRLIGTFLDPGFLGLILVFTLAGLVVRAWQEKKKKMLIVFGLITYLALALTYSRASYLAYLTAMGTIAWWKKSAKFFLFIFVIGLITVIFLPRPGGEGVRLERQSTIMERIINWQESLEIAGDNLLFGVGFNAYRYAQKRYGFLTEEEFRYSHAAAGADSSLLFVLATTGIFGLGAYLWLGAKALGLVRRLKNSLEVITLATFLAVFIHSFFHNSLFYPWIMGWLWIILGMVKGSKRR